MPESERSARSRAAAARRLRRELSTALMRGNASRARLRSIVESLVAEAEKGNLTAIKEVLDRLVGKTNTAAEDELPQQPLSVSWRDPQ